MKHFKEKSTEGCYVCLCKNGFYHSVPTDFPGFDERNKKCPNCTKEIGSKYSEDEDIKKIVIVKRENYFRIFKDDEEIEKLRENEEKKKKLDQINSMTLNEFKEKYIQKIIFNNEKGLPIIKKDFFKKKDKEIRNISQVSYRLLNYILYSHLFFARIYTRERRFDKCLPIGMTWGELLNECWIFLKDELVKEGINRIDIFINLVFKELFNELHNSECINEFAELITFEGNLEKLINDKINIAKTEIRNLKN